MDASEGGEFRRWRRGVAATIRRGVKKRSGDPELRELRALVKAYSGDTAGPDVLVFGDYAMLWTTGSDDSKRTLVDLIQAQLGRDVTFQAVAGPGYNPRIVGAFLSGLAQCPQRPRVVLVPTSVLMATKLFLENPHFAYKLEAEGLRFVAAGGKVRRLTRPDEASFEDYDRLPAPSLFGARRTAGELRLVRNSSPHPVADRSADEAPDGLLQRRTA